MRICFENISKSFAEGKNRRTIFKNLSVVFPEGKLSVILGRSGSGKSTLLNLISGIDPPDEGIIRIGDQLISQVKEPDRTLFRRRNIGFVFQFFNLIPTLSVLENVLLNLELDGKADTANRARVADLLRSVGLADRINSMPDELSGGEQQRCALVRALARDPAIVLADEPTGNLDQDTGAAVMELMTNMIRERQKTVIMATHNHDIVREADAVFSIRDCGIKQVEAKAP